MMKTTSRNQFSGVVQSVETGPVSAQVIIALPGGLQIVATITRAAAERLKLAIGVAAVALVKASEVVIVTDFDGYTLSARNQLTGKITRIERGAVTSLVTVSVQGVVRVTATVTTDAIDELELKTGVTATASFSAFSVMVAAEGAG